MKNRAVWISGIAAGLLMLVGIVIAMLASLPNLAEAGTNLGPGIFLLCFYFIWVIVSPILGVWFYQLLGNTVLIIDGLLIGVISGVFAMALAFILGIIQMFTQSESMLKDVFASGIAESLLTIGGPASTLLFTAGFGGFIGGIIFQNKTTK